MAPVAICALILAVSEQVFVLGSSKWIEGKNSARILESLRHGLPQFERIVVLMDPDVAGRQGRNALEAEFPGQFWHAFLPVQLATSVKASRYFLFLSATQMHAASWSSMMS